MFSQTSILGATAALCMIVASASGETITTLQFNELPDTPIPAQGLWIAGVTFSFSEDGQISPDQYQGAQYGAPFPGVTQNLVSPVFLGLDPGVVALMFDTPTDVLSFDAVYGLTTPDVFEVRLFDVNGAPIGTSDPLTSAQPCSPDALDCPNLSEGSYSYSGTAIRMAQLDFSSLLPGGTPAPFALDNLSFAVISAETSPVPEPASPGLVLGGLAALVTLRRRFRPRRRKAS